ncbi:male sterility protein-domain-containing protein [Coniella lustricola]|uniref:Male sterility protein-domain-containing protein n=1 Tax=Coniella lustricola TaxID=2025994 RepID=A0A2T3A1P3_9PEZI|nr:male sterility protein-domain-containing protein [Coniella lustricola]
MATTTDLDVDEVASDTDLFSLGLDSLQVTTATKKINQFLAGRGSLRTVDIRAVYSNPTIGALVNLVTGLVGASVSDGPVESDEQKMQKLYNLHTADLPISARPAEPKLAENLVVLLIGSTGSLGAYILDALLKDSRVRKVYCLNRGPNSLERMQKSFSDKGLQQMPLERAICLDGDFSKPRFALPINVYTTILNEVTNVIENAWQVDFHRSIDSFASQVHGIRRLVDFSSHSRFGAQVFFVSSIGAVMNRLSSADHETHRVPEAIFEDWQVPQGLGYAQSKFVSERILHVAAREAGIPAVVCRVGQIAGPRTEAGAWPKQEWFPSLVASSKHLGKIPKTLGSMDVVDWVPVDVLGQSIVELAALPVTNTNHGAGVYHLVNPQQTTWSELVPAVARGLDPSGEKLTIVTFEEWIEALRESASTTDDQSINPATKLIHFFEGLSHSSQSLGSLDVSRAVADSPILAKVQPVQDEWMQMWLRQWHF